MFEPAVFDLSDLPGDEVEYQAVGPDDAPADGAQPSPCLDELRERPDVELGLYPADRALRASERPLDAAGAPRTIDEAGLLLIESFEGFSPVRYLDSVGVATIGYGTTAADVYPLPERCTRAQAQGWLLSRLASKYEPAVRSLGVPLTQHQFDALCSFVYNLGPGSMASSWTIGRLLRAREYHRAADAMLMYDVAGGRVLPGLLSRRKAERALFLTADPPAPDPHHLLWFPDVAWVIGGRRILERGTVAEFYRLLAVRNANVRRLRVLQADVVLLRKRIWTVAHFDRPASWGVAHRGGRWQILERLSKIHL